MTEGGALLLLIEDDVPTRRALVANLVGHGHQVDEAGTAADGLRAWEDRRPDLILLDLGLPDRDGLAIIRQVRREASTPDPRPVGARATSATGSRPSSRAPTTT